MSGLMGLWIMTTVALAGPALLLEKKHFDVSMAFYTSWFTVSTILCLISFTAWVIHGGPLDGVPL